MHAILKKATLAAALATVSLSAHAAQTDIKVWAEVDNNLALLKSDGSALPDVVKMAYNPVRGLNAWTEQVRIFSNDTSKDVEVRLSSLAQLLATNAAPGAAAVPLSVSLNKKLLTAASQDFKASDLYDGSIPGASISMELSIAQATQAPITAAGQYEGIVSIILAAKP
nr:CS1 type fimbrial major subunit [Stenotrophomonas geniculata]